MINKKALEKMLSGTPQERKFLAEQSFGLFAIYYFSDYFKYALADYHYDFFQDLHDLTDNKIREVAWIGYRECAKTTVAKLGIIWLIANNKRKYINVDSFDKENAERILFDVAYEMVNNKRLQADFGVLFSKERGIQDIKQNRINNFVCENGVRVEAHSTQESVRGRLHLNQRPDALILDDIETNKTKDSQAYTKQVADHLSEAMAGMSTDGFMLYLGNYITEYGNIANIFKRAESDPKIRVRNIPIIIDGKPAWDAKYCLTDDEAKLTGKVSIEDKQRQLGSQVFSYEMMNQPIDDTIAEFKKEHIQTFEEDKLKHINTNTYITIDTAISEKTSADFTGITINRVSQENKWYITAYKIKVNPKDLIDHLFHLQDTYRPVLFGIEKTTFTMGIKPFLEDEMRNRNKFLNIRELTHTTQSKETRIRALIPRWESKSIFFVGNCDDLVQEMRTFPRGNHDDVLDSLAMQEEVAEKPINMDEWDRILGNNSVMYPDIGI
jgi:predicted phage terminase large subunit-like protein